MRIQRAVRANLLSWLLVGGVLSAQSADEFALAKPNPHFREYKTFRCTFTEAEGRDYDLKGAVRSREGQDYPEVIFDNIDYAKGTARLIGNVGSDDVRIIDGNLGLTFLEVSDTGNVLIDTIFKANGSEFDRTFRIATSRHIARSVGGDTVGQFYGTCRALI